MTALRPGDLIGLPSPDLIYHLAAFRYAMVGLAIVWAVLAARARPAISLAWGMFYAVVGVGFWTLALGRPYGLLVDVSLTQRLAECAVGAAAGGWEGVRSGEAASGIGAWLGRAGIPPGLLALGPAVMAPFVVPAVAALVAALWARRDLAWLGAVLWLAFATGDLDGLTAAGVLPGMWAHPFGALGLLATAALVLSAARIWKHDRAWIALGVAVAVGWIAAAVLWGRLGEPVTPFRFVERLLLASVQQGLWLPLGAYGLLRHGETASRALVAAGAVLLLLPWPARIALEPWGPHAVCRLGLILAASGPVAQLCVEAGAWLRPRLPTLARRTDLAVGAALLLAALAPGSFIVWWHPVHLDPVMAASLDPLPQALIEVAAQVRARTGPQAVVVAAPEYAPVVAALSGRRVLRARFLDRPEDADSRWRAEEKVLEGRTGDRLVQRYGVSHVLVAPGDFVDRGLQRPEDLAGRGPFTLVYENHEGFRLYAIRRSP